ncbi:heavy metal translocating P-type ATPase [Olsenella sp. HMSC062G07]|uniref:heavy metal translocating P-type ATPase n=1 Tax=Olsenella sp. HMSC062G07 TaxID=1739330 RepID=UPI000AED76FF|nr:heavy metal translocating P-type ATPase [Olsenella sp. HMSC062G07]
MARTAPVRETFDVTGMTCAACQARVQKVASQVAGVTSARVNLLKNSMDVAYDGSPATVQAVIDAVGKAGYGAAPRGPLPPAQACSQDARPSPEAGAFVDPAISANKATRAGLRQLVWSSVFALPLFYVAMGPMFGWPLPFRLGAPEGLGVRALVQLLLSAPILLVNHRTFSRGFSSLRQGAPNMDSLIAIGSSASFAYSLVTLGQMLWAYGSGRPEEVMGLMRFLYFDSAGMILALVALGKYFEARAKGKTTSAISALMDLTPKTATVLKDGRETQVRAEDLRVGDRVVVRAGESMPADGVVAQGNASVDESALSGEPIPVEKAPGSPVTAATVLQRGWIGVDVTAVGADTTLAAIIRLVDEATSSKAPIERRADRVAGVFVPMVLGLAALTFLTWCVIGGPDRLSAAFEHAVAVLVISCPCALGLATPTAIMVGTERGARYGILIKSAEALEAAGSLDAVVFDKTGTLTEGAPRVVSLDVAPSVTEDDLLRLAGALERKSEHPLAEAICACVDERGVQVSDNVSSFEQVAGGGVRARVDGGVVVVGNERLMGEEGVSLGELRQLAQRAAAQAQTPLFVAKDGVVQGLISVADRLRPSARPTVERLRRQRIRTVLLTGDQRRAAEVIGRAVGVDEVIADVLPADKERHVRALQEGGHRVAMVGDGINDAPALARADVGMAVGAGTDIAISSADIVLMRSDPADVASAIELSRATLRDIRQNLFWALLYNCACIPVAMGVLSPWGVTVSPMVGAAAMGLSSVFVVTNALRLFGWHPSVAREATPPDLSSSFAHESSRREPAATIKKGTSDMTTKTINIEGMMCAHCAAHVTEALEGLKDVRDVRVSLEDGQATLDAGPLVSNERLQKAVEAAGYTVTGIR